MFNPTDITGDMQKDAQRHFRRNGFVRMPDGSYVPEYYATDPKNPNRPLSLQEIESRLKQRFKRN